MPPLKWKAAWLYSIGLHAGEAEAEQDGERQALEQALAVAFAQRMMGPGHGDARGQQDQRVEQRQREGIEGVDALGRPDLPIASVGNRLALK